MPTEIKTDKQERIMDFKYDEILDLWVSDTDYRGQKIKIRLYCCDDDDFSNLANKALCDVDSHWELLKAAIVSKLLADYNEEWGQRLTPDEFFSRLTLVTIDFDARDIMYKLLWSDSGLFGGHSIKVSWDPEVTFDANISIFG
jgi:hypothetical protein